MKYFLILIILSCGFVYLLNNHYFNNDIKNADVDIQEKLPPQKHIVVMYSTSTCGNCVIKKQEFEKHNIRYVEKVTDTDKSALKSFQTLLLQNGMNGNYGAPVFLY